MHTTAHIKSRVVDATLAQAMMVMTTICLRTGLSCLSRRARTAHGWHTMGPHDGDDDGDDDDENDVWLEQLSTYTIIANPSTQNPQP